MNARSKWTARAGLAVFAALVAAGPAGAAGDAVALLSRADAIRNPQTSFVVDVDLVAYEKGQKTDSTTVTTHSRKDSSNGQFLSLVYIERPNRDEGKIILRNGNLLWFFDPASKASVRLSPRQRLVGNASNGDVVTANFALDYQVELVGEEEVMDGDRRMTPAYRLHLTSESDITPYNAIDLWVDKASSRPVKGEFFTQSGRLLKAAWYRGWRPVLGETRPTEIVIADGFDPQNVTLMRMSNFRTQDLPQSWFSNSWLPSFRKP